ncbi:MAG: aminoglycoside 6-adenylyltransferase [Thermomicrobiales bacterium]
MADHLDDYRALEGRVKEWARSRPDVQAVLVVGSRARIDVPADEYSDLDLVLFADDPDQLLDRDDWLADIGPVVMSFVEGTAVGAWRERRAIFEPMMDVDFSAVPSNLLDLDFAVAGPVTEIIRPVVDRGFRILDDESGRLSRLYDLPVSPRLAWTLPTETMLTNLVLDFWYHAMWTTKKVLRGEILVARTCLDDSMKDKLLKVINWLAHLGKPDTDTWHGRRFFETWSDHDIVETFHSTYGTATRTQILDDLSRTMDLFSQVARDAASRLGYPYPDAAERHIRGWISETVPDTLS